MKLSRLLPLLLLPLAAAVFADPGELNDVEEPVVGPWQEDAYALPAFPKDADLIEFYVSAAATAKYYIDQHSLSAGGKDKVIRYTMVVKTSGGATNTSYEGMRCDTGEIRLYATGTATGEWAKSRQSEWHRPKTYNVQQKSLAEFYFCPNHLPIKSAAEGINALKLGTHPAVTQRYQ